MEGVFAIFLEWLFCTYVAINLYAFLQTLKKREFFCQIPNFFSINGVYYM